MEKKEIFDYIKEATKKETSLSTLANDLKLSEMSILGYINLLKSSGENISVINKDHDVILLNQGEYNFNTKNYFTLEPDDNNEFEFMLVSDTRQGSKYAQLSLLNDAYLKAYEMGIKNVIHAGNISEGLYPNGTLYEDSLEIKDTLQQADYIIKHYPYIEGMTTYFIGGQKEKNHLQKNKIDLGKRISSSRPDLIYLGLGNCYINIGKTKVLLSNLKLEKTYTESYQIQKVINSIRSEDKPDIYICGGLLKLNYFPYRFVKCISVPSLVATTPEMTDNKSNNVVGVWYGKIKLNRFGYLEDIQLMASPYYETLKDNHIKAKTLKLGGNK